MNVNDNETALYRSRRANSEERIARLLNNRNKSLAVLLALTTLFIIALLIRIHGVTGIPLDFHPTKQYRSALTARAFYYRSVESIPDWKRDVAEANLQRLGVLVPPISDYTAALAYRLVGKEELWIPRLVSSLAWLIGGAFLYAIGRNLVSPLAAVASTAFYLLLPFGVQASQSFQPDPLMIMAMMIALYGLIRYYQRPTWLLLIVASSASAAAILVKPVCLFIIFSAFVALQFQAHRRAISTWRWQSLVFVVSSLLPGAIFYGYGIVFTDTLNMQAEVSFLPSFVLEFRFWDGWLKRIRLVMGYTYYLAGLFSLVFWPADWRRRFILSLWAGYFAMSLSIAYPSSSHDYYHLPLIPIVALSVAPVVSLVTTDLLKRIAGFRWLVITAFLLGMMVFLAAGTSVQAHRKLPDFTHNIASARAIGELVEHSTQTIVLDGEDYGRSAMYYGEFSGVFWPPWYDIRDEALWGEPRLTVEERFRRYFLDHQPEYFVVTDLGELAHQEDLNVFLLEGYRTLKGTADFVIFDLRDPLVSYPKSRHVALSSDAPQYSR